MNKLLVVFNTSGLADRENVNHYIKNIDSILKQSFNGFEVVLSSCMNKPKDIDILKNYFQDKISYNLIFDRIPVNITFNKTVRDCVKNLGKFEGYVYVDSGCYFPSINILDEMYSLFQSGKYSMVTAPTDTDTAFPDSYGWNYPPKDWVVPIGKAHNCHVQLFSHDIYKAMDNRIIPDIFASFCTESTFPYLNASVQKRWIISSKIIVQHKCGLDEASMCYGHPPIVHGKPYWGHLVPQCKKTMFEIITDEEGTACGFGYDECGGTKMHNRAAYNENGEPLFPERLRNFIVNNIFLSNEEFDYDKINRNFLKRGK